MKNKLTPVKALALAALIGGTYADACWYEVSETCVESGTVVDTVPFQDISLGNYLSAELVATSTWNSWPATDEENGAGAYVDEATHTCAGPAQFTNPVTGRGAGDAETVGFWQTATVNYAGTNSPITYTGVNYNNTCE